MKNVKLMLSLLLVMVIAITLTNCGNDDDPAALSLSSLTAGSIDLNGATSPNNVPTDASITATFSSNVDAETATESNITLTRDYDDAMMPLDIDVSGSTVTITPVDELGSGTLYILKFSGLESTSGGAMSGVIERNFTTAGAFSPAGVVAHFTFENSTNDVVGDYDPTVDDVVNITYVDSRSAAAGKAASFDGDASIIEVPNADDFMSYGDFAVSFWVKADGTKAGHFVFGLGAWKGFQFELASAWDAAKAAIQYEQGDGTMDSEDSWFPGNGQTKDNGGWQGWTFHKDVTASGGVGETYFKSKWAHVVITYNAASKINTMYINGEKVKEHDFNLWPTDSKKKTVVGVGYAGNDAPGNEMAFGFIQARENRIITDTWADYAHADATNHFKGQLDDFRVFNHSLTSTEVLLMYNSEKP
jgi:hypothetical protein